MDVGRIEEIPKHTDMHQKVEIPEREAHPFRGWGCGGQRDENK